MEDSGAPCQSGEGQEFTVEACPDGVVALRSGHLYVAAEPDGRITLSRVQAREWEAFLPLRNDVLTEIREVATKDWVAQTRRRTISADTVRFAPDFRMVVGDMLVDLRSYAVGNPLKRKRAEAGSLDLLYGGWRVERMHRYQPLIYFTAFGDDGIFECLEIALASLARFARWSGSVLILTDRTSEEMAPLIPSALRAQTHLHRCNPVDVLGFTLARYTVDEIPFAKAHQPLLYVDTDVVFDRPLDDLMMDILLSDNISFLPEREMFDYDFYGEPLFHADDRFRPAYTRGLSSGAIGIPSLERAADSFRTIVAVADAYAAAQGRRDVFNCYDQPFANYIFHKLGGFDPAILDRHASLHHSSYADVKDRKGFVHFCGGVGVSAPKLVRMAQYFDDLAQLERVPEAAEAL